MNIAESRAQMRQLQVVLERIIDKDPEQEVRGLAIPVLDAIVEAVKQHLVHHEVAQQIAGIISVNAVAEGEPLRATDALIVVAALRTALGEEVPLPVSIPREPDWPDIRTMGF